MERDKKLRSVTRTRFTKVVNVLDSEISKSNADLGVIKDKFSKLKDIDFKLKDLDQKMLDHMMVADAEEDTLNCEIEEAEHYSDTFITLERKVRELIDSDNKSDVKSLGSSNGSLMAKSYKLPKIEIRKFDGELINWLPFWAQFEKIHEDTELHDADKFHYLVQSMQSNTRARELIESYPQTADNYAKAVQALKQRYGQKDLLVEIYVRELLKLMMANVKTPPDERRSVAKLYDKLETQLRSLESLGVDTKENTAWLFPMIESCLPEDVLVAWQRSPLNNCDESKNSNSNSSSRLNNLLDFLRREVEGEERRLLARRGFEGSSPKEKLRNKFKQNSNIPTAAGLFSAKEMGCLFCENNHQSKDCITAQSMPFKDKRAKIYEKRCCLKCLKPGHLAKACKRTVQCNICAKGHYVLLCPDLPCNRKEKTHVSEVVQSALANQQCTRDVTLMTLMVNIMGNNGYRRVRALLDPGSQKSYILESTALEVKLKPIGNVNIAHSLFGGTQTETKCHKVYTVALCSNLSELDTLREFEFLGQDIICGEIPRTPKGAWLNELKGSRIWLSDLGRDSPKIELLIGSDIYGSLLSGRVKQLENGLTAIETHLGWTICGPSPKKDEQTDYSSLVVISMHSRNMSVDYLWDLETIGIKDPRENLTKLEEDKIVHQHFLNTVHQLEDGRFCVGLPWLGNQEGIPSNRHIAERRLFNTTRKLRAKCIFSEYDRVFQEWLAEGVIEKVSPEDLNRNCHYLPHQPVVKANSNTTKIRPVFDASCKDKGNLSLNDCLASGPNVIEQIPAILLKFREKAIGVIADIRKAFLQIEVKEEDRDYLRFLWWKNNHQIEVFRHKRVVFGVTCSPYLLGAVILHHLKGVSSEFGALPQKLMECLYMDNCVTSVDTEAELVDLVEKSTEIFAKAKMDLRMWQFGPIHRVKEVYSRLPPSVDIERSEEASVLGMKWNLLEDTLNVTPKFGVIINSLSKRDLLSHTQQIFDPIGFLVPVLLPAKLLIQQAWTVKTDWDEPLPSTIQENFMKWYSELDTLADIKIPRRVGHGIRAHWSIHIFCDASQSAYAAAAFLRCPENKGVSVQLLMAKSRLGPLKKTTIPRMELLACMLGVRLSRVRDATAFEILGVDLAGPLYLKNKTKAWIVLFTCARLIRSIKDLLVRILGHSSVYYEEMSTILCDAEATINSRPLTYIHEDFDSLIPLSPSMFLHDSKYVGVPDLDKLDSKKFQDRYRHCQRLREALRSRFRSEYLGQLVQKANERTPKLSVGDVVIVKVEDKRRLHWPMARIVELFPGRDGHSRVAKVRTKLGTLIRPVQKLYPLEVSSGDPILRSKGDTTIEEAHMALRLRRSPIPLFWHNQSIQLALGRADSPGPARNWSADAMDSVSKIKESGERKTKPQYLRKQGSLPKNMECCATAQEDSSPDHKTLASSRRCEIWNLPLNRCSHPLLYVKFSGDIGMLELLRHHFKVRCVVRFAVLGILKLASQLHKLCKFLFSVFSFGLISRFQDTVWTPESETKKCPTCMFADGMVESYCSLEACFTQEMLQSTKDQLETLEKHADALLNLDDSFRENPPKKTTAIFLDMTSAFDRVWREKLREKLHNIGTYSLESRRQNKNNLDRHFGNEEPEDEISLTTCGLVDPPFSENEVKLTAFKFGRRKSSGPEGIDNTVVKALVRMHPSLLSRLFNRCLDTGTFPEARKVARVVLLGKSGRKGNSPNDYRPLSLLVCLGKVLDSLLAQRLKHWQESNELLSSFQHGFREGKSTTTALNEVLEGVEMGLNKGAWVLFVALDIDGAFNSMSWNKLMRNLMNMGCPDNLCSLIRDFLRDRRISLSFGGRKLERNCARGCPQGSCCGPILWNILVNTVFQEELHEGDRLVLYADDQFLTIETASRAKAEKCVETSLQIFSIWAHDSGLKFNVSKTKALSFRPRDIRTKRKGIKWEHKPAIWMEGRRVALVNRMTILGVVIDDKMGWQYQAEEMVARGKEALGPTGIGTEVFTDGSKSGTNTGAGVVIYTNGELIFQEGLALRVDELVFSAELVAIRVALRVCAEKNFIPDRLYSDCMSALVVINLEKGQLAHQIIQELEMMTRAPELPWFRRHSLIEGNEFADRIAKAGCFRGISLRTPVTKKEVYRRIRGHVQDLWLDRWRNSVKGREVFNGVTTPKYLCKVMSYKLIRVVRDMDTSPSLHRFKIKRNPDCVYGERDVNARHYVLDCPRVVGVQEERRRARGAIESKLLRNHSKLLEKAHDVAAELFLSSMAPALQKFDIDPEQQLYTPKIVDIAADVMEMHGTSEALYWTRQQRHSRVK
ncbi:hypothetical protein LAZ67_9003051 [Cordylochernes scorpioides]|uniref:Reverse transcriptase n=1 Tax=Cordylochernes scorpioides TaxID=51811 RepID=A0ABY6KZ77_9ARAC|nr:hypothetical protein LAZ67_9003051 [Cordylochernes scorpioides]